MYSSVSNEFKTECKRDVNSYKRIAKIHVVEDNIDITNDNDLVDFTIEETAYSGNTFVGNSVAKKISLNIINDGSYNLENKEIEVYVGIDYVGDGSNVELVPYGNFIISKPMNEEVKNTSNYVGYDYMIKTEVPYTEDNIVYPMSLYNYLSAICSNVGITLGNQTIPNGNYQVLGNAYTNGEKVRQVIEEIARCCGGFAVIGRDNKLYIKTLAVINDNEDETITPGEYFEDFGTNNTYGPVNKVAIALNYNVIGEDTVIQDAESIAENGLTEIRISDISFLNSEAQRELVINDFWAQLHNLIYKPYSTNYYGYPYVDSGDIVKITKPDSSNIYSYILNHKFTYNGAFSGNIEAPALSDVEDEYKETTDAKSAIRNTELKVDKINGQITSIVEEIGDREGKTTSITQDIDHIESLVQDTIDLTDETTGLNPITLENCREGNLLELRIRGNNTVFKPLVPTNSLVPSNSLTPLGSVLKVTHKNDTESQPVDTFDYYDLGIETELKQSGQYYDEYVIKEGKGYELRRILDGGVIVENPEPTNVIDLNIPLTRGTNYIDIPKYTANMYAKWVIFNEVTNYFATGLELQSSIEQSSSEIKLSVMETVTDDFLAKKTVESSIDLGILEDEGYIAMKTNKLTIDSDYFKLLADGEIQTDKGKIGDLILTKTSDGSFLYKNSVDSSTTYQSGLYIPNYAMGLWQPFIYGGHNTSQSSITADNTNLLIRHDGTIYSKYLKMNGDSGAIEVDYDSGRMAMHLTKYGILWKLDDTSNGSFFHIYRGGAAMEFGLYDAPSISIVDRVHVEGMANFVKYNPNSSNTDRLGPYLTLTSRLFIYGNRHDGVNNSAYIQGYEVQTSASDERLKENIKDSDTSALEILDNIKIRQFDWRKDKHLKQGGKHVHNGFIAQEVQKIDDTLVNYDEEFDTYQMNDLNLIALNSKAIQELNTKIEEQQKTIDKQRELIQDLIKRIDKLEKGE